MKNILISTNSIIKNDEIFYSVDSSWYEYFKNDYINLISDYQNQKMKISSKYKNCVI